MFDSFSCSSPAHNHDIIALSKQPQQNRVIPKSHFEKNPPIPSSLIARQNSKFTRNGSALRLPPFSIKVKHFTESRSDTTGIRDTTHEVTQRISVSRNTARENTTKFPKNGFCYDFGLKNLGK
jgi:hypothetical protein